MDGLGLTSCVSGSSMPPSRVSMCETDSSPIVGKFFLLSPLCCSKRADSLNAVVNLWGYTTQDEKSRIEANASMQRSSLPCVYTNEGTAGKVKNLDN
jgi:hypothetical protein